MKQVQIYLTPLLVTLTIAFCLVGVFDAVKSKSHGTPEIPESRISASDDTKSLPRRTQAAEFISGPLASNIGELCIFNLNDPKQRADWAVIRQSKDDATINAYVDSSGSSVVFTSKDASRYTVVAAVVDDGSPKILQHICDYGMTPNPQPQPGPEPKPEPVSLIEWVAQNVPEPCKTESGILASIYESAAQGIERGTIKTRDAAFAVLRSNTQTKIRNIAWNEFLEQLSVKITERLGENRDIKELAAVFSEIATGLKKVSVPKSYVVPRTVSIPAPAATSSYIVPQSPVQYNGVTTQQCTGPSCPAPQIYYGGSL